MKTLDPQAREGYLFYSINTPGFFREIELPEYPEDMDHRQHALWESLHDDAEFLGTFVQRTTYQLG